MKRLTLAVLLVVLAASSATHADAPEPKYYASINIRCDAPQRLVDAVRTHMIKTVAGLRDSGIDMEIMPFVQPPHPETKMVSIGVTASVRSPARLSVLQRAQVALLGCLGDFDVSGVHVMLSLTTAPPTPRQRP